MSGRLSGQASFPAILRKFWAPVQQKKCSFFVGLSARVYGPGESEKSGVAPPRWKESLGERRFSLFDRAGPPPLASPEFVAILGTCSRA
jgi:hypothetical protein